ncbi:MAG: hypothetical protein Q8N23_28895 [Archangium sp.]|nr:hypothetical protein [Archangium sp.]MDP3156724.1 hypothetical protein [Archangium sp.]MDP3574658.1 hypothetical protein [Archangium sp.]
MSAPPHGPIARVVEALMGASLCAIALYSSIVELGCDRPEPLRLLGALALFVVGAQGLISAARGTPSWLYRIGPLP